MARCPRLRRLSADVRIGVITHRFFIKFFHQVAARVRAFRVMGHETWLATTDGTVTGRLVVSTRWPERGLPSRVALTNSIMRAALPCPLCGEPARVIEPSDPEWLLIEGCACGGFGVWSDLVAGRRLKHIGPDERGKLQARVRDLRALGRDACVVTADGTLRGPLIVAAGRQDRPRRRSSDAR